MRPVDQRPSLDGERVIVLAAGFRCLGYLDKKGVWRHDKDNKAIENVNGWIPFVN